jgi:hypothetical protein
MDALSLIMQLINLRGGGPAARTAKLSEAAATKKAITEAAGKNADVSRNLIKGLAEKGDLGSRRNIGPTGILGLSKTGKRVQSLYGSDTADDIYRMQRAAKERKEKIDYGVQLEQDIKANDQLVKLMQSADKFSGTEKIGIMNRARTFSAKYLPGFESYIADGMSTKELLDAYNKWRGSGFTSAFNTVLNNPSEKNQNKLNIQAELKNRFIKKGSTDQEQKLVLEAINKQYEREAQKKAEAEKPAPTPTVSEKETRAEHFIKNYGPTRNKFDQIIEMKSAQRLPRLAGWLRTREIEAKKGTYSNDELNQIEQAIMTGLSIEPKVQNSINLLREQGATEKEIQILLKKYLTGK